MFFSDGRKPIRVAVISAHPDDETFGAGGTLAKHAMFGDDLYICVVTEGYAPDWPKETLQIMHEQANEAFRTLGIQNMSFLKFPTVKLNAVPGKELNDRITEFIEDVDPQVIYAPSPGDLNSDHSIVARSTAVAIRPTTGKSRSLVYYETLSSTEWGRVFLQSNFMPNLYVNIGLTIEQKLRAATCYELELRQFPHPRSLEGIRVLAKYRGMEAGLDASEAFYLALHIA